jgi:tight adherence protein B
VDAILSPRFLTALAAFGAVTLAVLALALFWEGMRGAMRRRSVDQALKKLSGTGTGVKGSSMPGLLKEDRSGMPSWLSPVAERVPSLSDLGLFLEQARSEWSVGTFVLLTAGLSLAGGTLVLLFGFSFLIALAGAAAFGSIPYLLVVKKRRKRLFDFEEQFPEAIELMARSARAGHAFQAGLQEVAEEAPDPVGEEFRQVFEEQRFGLPLAESLLGLGDRIDLVDVRMFVTSVLIQKETGGNLAENMDNLARLIRERFRFKRQIKVHTAHGRMTGFVLGVAPIVAGVLIFLVNPDYMRPLFTEDLGKWMLGAGITLQLIGFYIIRRMTDIEY